MKIKKKILQHELGYTAQQGWDPVSGLGSINFKKFATLFGIDLKGHTWPVEFDVGGGGEHSDCVLPHIPTNKLLFAGKTSLYIETVKIMQSHPHHTHARARILW